MTRYTSNADQTGLAVGTTLTTGNSGGGTNTAMSVVNGTVTIDNTPPLLGTKDYLVSATTATKGDCVINCASTTSVAARMYFTLSGIPTGSTQWLTMQPAGVNYVGINSSGKMYVDLNNTLTYTSTVTLSTGTEYRVEYGLTIAASGATVNWALYLGNSATPLDSFTTAAGNTGTTAVTGVAFGKATSAGNLSSFSMEYLVIDNASSALIGGIANNPPTAAFTHSETGLGTSVDGTGSSPTSPATITGYDWDWGDSTTHGTGSTASHTYAAAGTYTVVLTVTDSNGLTGTTSHSITVTAPGTQASPATTTVTTGFTSNSGTVLNAITDLSSGAPNLTTFVSGGNGSVLKGAITPISPPNSGSPFVALIAADRNLASSGSITAKLYEADGTTLRSTVTAAIPDMTSSGGNAGTLANQFVQVAWPWTDVQNVTNWNQLVYEFTFTVT